jgi:hypothetical protein
VKTLTAIVAATVLLAQAADAQPIPGMSPKEKARAEQKQARDRDVDSQYKAAIELIPDSGKNVDPWGNLRTPGTPAPPATKPR